MLQSPFIIEPTPPFDFELTAGYRAANRGYLGNKEYSDGVYRQIIDSNDKALLASVRSTGSVDSPKLEVTLEGEHPGSEPADAVAKEVSWALGAGAQLAQFYLMAEEDEPLQRYVRQLYGLHPTHTSSMFEAIVVAVTGQQIAAGVAHTIRTLLIQEYGRSVTIGGQTYNLFPTAEALASAGVLGLRKIKLSTRKAEYIVDLASKITSRELDLEACHHLSSTEVDHMLMQLRGIGKWTVQWLKIVAMNYHDAFPSGDLALRRFVSFLYLDSHLIDETAVEEFSQRWYPHRALVTVYLFAAARMGLLETKRI